MNSNCYIWGRDDQQRRLDNRELNIRTLDIGYFGYEVGSGSRDDLEYPLQLFLLPDTWLPLVPWLPGPVLLPDTFGYTYHIWEPYVSSLDSWACDNGDITVVGDSLIRKVATETLVELW